MKFERSEIGALFSKLRTAVPEVRAVGNDSTGILLSGPDAFATNLELSIRAELSSPVPQGVVIPPRGVDFISGAVAPEININVTKSGLVIESGTAQDANTASKSCWKRMVRQTFLNRHMHRLWPGI